MSIFAEKGTQPRARQGAADRPSASLADLPKHRVLPSVMRVRRLEGETTVTGTGTACAPAAPPFAARSIF